MNWVFNLLLVVIFSTLAVGLSNGDIAKVKNLYNQTKPYEMRIIFKRILEEYSTDPDGNVFEHFVHGRPNPCSHHAQISDDLLSKYKYTNVEMKAIRAAEEPWMVTLDDETYFPVTILLFCELSTILEGVSGNFTMLLLDPKRHTFLQVNDYPWSGINRAKAPVDIVNARALYLSYHDNGHKAKIFLTSIQDEEMKLFQYCDMLRRHDYIIGSTHHVVKGGVKIQDYVFHLNKRKKLCVPGVLYCEIEYNENVTKVFEDIAPGTKDVLYYIPRLPFLAMQLTSIKSLEFFKAKPLQTKTDGKEALVWN